MQSERCTKQEINAEITILQDQELEIKDAIGEMRALKQEMDNKVQTFEQAKVQLQVSNTFSISLSVPPFWYTACR